MNSFAKSVYIDDSVYNHLIFENTETIQPRSAFMNMYDHVCLHNAMGIELKIVFDFQYIHPRFMVMWVYIFTPY